MTASVSKTLCNEGQRRRERVPKAVRFAVIVAFVNFLLFICVAMTIGGDAINGKQEAGRYYLGHKSTYTEVSRHLWLYSKVHAISVFVTHGGALLAGAAFAAARVLSGGDRPANV
jgi:hypothetical protein